MSHWYKFQVDAYTFVVCKAQRKAEIEKELPFKVKFAGCVALEKIGALRTDNNFVVLNSVSRLKAILPYLPIPGASTSSSSTSDMSSSSLSLA